MDPPATATGRSNILLVDDRTENLLALEAVLAPLDQNVVSVSSADEALRKVLDHDFAAILLDVQMPGTDGFETAALIRQREKNKHIPIVFITAIHSDNAAIKRGFDLGAFDYVTKPFDPDVLRAKVRALVEMDKADRRLNSRIKELEEQSSRMRTVVETLEAAAYRAQRLQDEHAYVVELRELNRLQDDLFGAVSHEFRSPLGVIGGLVLTLREHGDAIDATQRVAALDAIERQVERLSWLVANLLDGRRRLTSIGETLPDLREIVDGAVGWVDDLYVDQASEIGVAIPPRTSVVADPTAMHLVFVNLLSNAVKFSPPGERVTVTGRTDGALVTVSVSNTAAPLTEEQRELIFRPFIRLDDADPAAPSGVGLGLHLVRRFVELYGGTVTVGSGSGTITFTVQLPAAVRSRRVVDLRDDDRATRPRDDDRATRQ
ncbi:MAG: hybrid sensor histidine kinase/response regulator [Actinomycetota bacterium]